MFVIVGIIDNKAISEVKCFLKLLKNNITLEEAVEKCKKFRLELREGNLRLKRSHNYSFQVSKPNLF